MASRRTGKRSVTIEEVPLVLPEPAPILNPGDYFREKRKVLSVEVAYAMGGMNYFSGTSSPRGYYLRAIPMTYQKLLGGGESKSMILFEGGGTLLEPAARYSDKVLASIAATVKDRPVFAQLKAAVISKEHLTVAQEATS